MRILVAGATGAVGKRLVPLLVRDGHTVFGLTRSTEKSELIRSWGAQPVIGDGLDAAVVTAAVDEAQPEVVVHEMTALAGISDLRRFDRTFAQSNRLRTRGLDLLLAAARRAGARRFVAQSYCGWPYARAGGPVKSEDAPLDPRPPRELRRSLQAIRYLEHTVVDQRSLEGLVLRYGAFYGPDTGMFEADAVEQVRRGRVPLIGKAQGWWSFAHIDDVAEATRIAVSRGAAGIYNIVDDEPARVCDWLPALAAAVGGKRPPRIPAWLARIAAGKHLVTMMTEGRAGSNAKAKRELGWTPAHPSWRQGFVEVAREIRAG
jgi:nucleoside-diphosphate-sugar epimerase